MKIKFISPIGLYTPDLFSSFIETFIQNGHTIVEDVTESDCCFFDLHTRTGKYNWTDLCYVIDKKLPVVVFDFWDYGGCEDEWSNWIGKDNWYEVRKYQPTHHWADFLYHVIENNNQLIFFVRKMEKNEDYKEAKVYPIELCMYKDCIFEPTSKIELFNRPYDIYFAGNISPARKKVYEALRYTDLKLDWHWTNENGKLPHDEWMSRARQSKMFLSADGGGLNDERAYQLIYCGVLLKQDNEQIVLHDFSGGVDCIKIPETPTEADIANIVMVLNDKDHLYSMYNKGIEKMRRYFNPNYRAQYILDTLKNNGIE